MPTFKYVQQRLDKADADRRATHKRDYLDRGIPQRHTRQWSTDHVEPRWGLHESTYAIEYHSTPHGPMLACVRPITGPMGTPDLKDGVIRDLGAAVGAAKRQQAREATMQQWLTFQQTMAILDLTESQLRSIVAAGEITMNQPKRDGRRRFAPGAIRAYLLANGSYTPELIEAIMARVHAATETTQTTKSA